jgi:hypothetical protein
MLNFPRRADLSAGEEMNGLEIHVRVEVKRP